MSDLEKNLHDIHYEDFFIHFELDWNKHEIPISQSIITEQSISVIIQEVTAKLFGIQIECKIVVYPNEDGSLIKKIGIGLGVIGVAMLPDTINWISLWLTWKERKTHMQERTVGVKESVEGFIAQKNQELENKGIWYDAYYKAYDAKNKLYYAALTNPDVKWLGFDRTEKFPILRNEFAYRIVDLNTKTSPIDPIEKYHELIVVSSINTKEESKLARQVKDKNNKKRFDVYMCDKVFYERFLENPIVLKKLIVKMQYKLKRDEEWVIQIDRKEIVKIYKYNDVILFDLPEWIIIESAPFDINHNVDLSIPIDNTDRLDLFSKGV